MQVPAASDSRIILICMTTRQLRRPLIPCELEQCEQCGVDVWVDATVKHDACLCMPCALKHPELIECIIHPDVAATLRRFGMSDAEIERVSEFMGQMLKRQRLLG